MKITICICTRKRPDGLERLLDSIFRLDNLKFNFLISAVSIVENDDLLYSEDVVLKYFNKSIPVIYNIEKQRGISYARNTSIKKAPISDYYFFVDDDQVLKSDCLNHLIETILLFKCDCVYGINPPIFDSKTNSAYYNFFTPPSKPIGALLDRAPTNCLLVSEKMIKSNPGPFDTRFNLIGGGDSFFCIQAIKKGFQIRSNQNAMAYEIVPDNRVTIEYVFKRAFKSSLAKSYQYKYLGYSLFKRYKRYLTLFGKLFFSLVFMVPIYLIMRKKKYFGIRKFAESIGGISFIFKIKYEIYNEEKFV